MTMAKKSFNESNDIYVYISIYLFHSSPKTTARQLFKEVSSHYLSNSLKCKFQKFALK